MADVRNDLTNGVWFLRTGEAVFIEEAKFRDAAEAPFRMLTRVLKLLLADASAASLPAYVFDGAAVSEWIKANPLPDGEDHVMGWYAQLEDVCIRSGLSLLWRGKLTTSIRGHARICATIQSCTEAVSQLQWPPDAAIEKVVLGSDGASSSSKMNWDALTGPCCRPTSAGGESLQAAPALVASATDTADGHCVVLDIAGRNLLLGIDWLLAPFDADEAQGKLDAMRAFFTRAEEFVVSCSVPCADSLLRHTPLPETRLMPLLEIAECVRREVFGRFESVVQDARELDDATTAEVLAAVERSRAVSQGWSAAIGAALGGGLGRLFGRGAEGAVVGSIFGATEAPLEALNESTHAATLALTSAVEIEENVRVCFAALSILPEALLKCLAAKCFGAATDFAQLNRSIGRWQTLIDERLQYATECFDELVRRDERETDAAMQEVEKAYADVEKARNGGCVSAVLAITLPFGVLATCRLLGLV